MILFLKSRSSRSSVHDNNHNHEQENKIDWSWTSLTVWRKSFIFSCRGFTVIDSNGSLVFRVDNYTGRPDEVTLMDGSRKPVFTLCRRKKLRLADNWAVHEGEVAGHNRSSKRPIFRVRKHVNILQPNINVLAHVYHGPSDKKSAYVIEGSFGHNIMPGVG